MCVPGGYPKKRTVEYERWDVAQFLTFPRELGHPGRYWAINRRQFEEYYKIRPKMYTTVLDWNKEHAYERRSFVDKDTGDTYFRDILNYRIAMEKDRVMFDIDPPDRKEWEKDYVKQVNKGGPIAWEQCKILHDYFENIGAIHELSYTGRGYRILVFFSKIYHPDVIRGWMCDLSDSLKNRTDTTCWGESARLTKVWGTRNPKSSFRCPSDDPDKPGGLYVTSLTNEEFERGHEVIMHLSEHKRRIVIIHGGKDYGPLNLDFVIPIAYEIHRKTDFTEAGNLAAAVCMLRPCEKLFFLFGLPDFVKDSHLFRVSFARALMSMGLDREEIVPAFSRCDDYQISTTRKQLNSIKPGIPPAPCEKSKYSRAKIHLKGRLSTEITNRSGINPCAKCEGFGDDIIREIVFDVDYSPIFGKNIERLTEDLEKVGIKISLPDVRDTESINQMRYIIYLRNSGVFFGHAAAICRHVFGKESISADADWFSVVYTNFFGVKDYFENKKESADETLSIN